MTGLAVTAESTSDKAPTAAGRGRFAGIALAVAVAFFVLAGGIYALIADRDASGDLETTVAGGTARGGDAIAFRRQLTTHLAAKPRDGRAWIALARLDMESDRFTDAAKHYAKAIEVSAKVARDPGVLCEYADALGMAQGGRLEGEPAAAIERALALDPAHPKALEMAGSTAYERGDFRKAVGHWRALLPHFPEGTVARAELAAAIERAERRATVTLPTPAASRGG